MSDMREFIGYLNRYSDIARNNRYRVTFNTPPIMLGQFNDAPRNLALQCETAELPGRSFATTDIRTYGPIVKIPYQTTYNDMSLTFYCTGTKVDGLLNVLNNFVGGAASQALSGILGSGIASEVGNLATSVLRQVEGGDSGGLWERAFFDKWMNSIQPMESYSASYNIAYRDDYTTSINVTHYDNQNNPTTTYQFVEAWPIAIDHQTLNWADDTLLLLTVTFAYTRWGHGTSDSDGFLLNPISSLLDTVATQITGNPLAGRLVSGLLSTDPVGSFQTNISSGLNSLLNRI